MNPNDSKQRDRLSNSIDWSYRQLDPFRKLTLGLVQEYAGSGYGQSDVRKQEIVMNLLNQAAVAYTMALAANRPRVLYSSQYMQFKYFSRMFSLAMNNLIKEIELEKSLRSCVLDAFFCVGFMRVFQKDTEPVMLQPGVWIDPGMPWASDISIDNIFFDYRATKWSEVAYVGDVYRIPFEDLKKRDRYEPKVVADLQPNSKYSGSDAERLERIAKELETDNDEFEPHIDICDVWMRKDNTIHTYAVDMTSGGLKLKSKPLLVRDNEIDGNPYTLFGFHPVPQNIMPTSPAQHISYMSRLINFLLLKQSERAKRHTRVHTYSPASAKDAENLQRARDDEWRMVQDPQDIGEINIGGVNAETQAFVGGLIQMFDRMAGNLSAMMGLGPQSDTLGQDEMIHNQVSAMESMMKMRVKEATVETLSKLGHLLWHNKSLVLPGKLPIEGTRGYFTDGTWRPEYRDGSFMDYECDIDEDSMSYRSSQDRVNGINGLLTQIYFPLMEALGGQGGQIDMKELSTIHAEMLNLPRLKHVIRFMDAQEEPASPASRPMPATTTRRYVRTSQSAGGSVAGQQSAQQLAWLGAANQSQQKNAMQV